MPPSAGRPRDPDVDARIVDATRALLAEGGQEAVTIAAVAARAGIGRPTVYRRFPDADTLTMAVLYADLDALVVEIRAAHDPARTVEDQLAAIARRFFTYYSRQPAVSRAMLQRSLFATGPWMERFSLQIFAFLGWIAAALEDCRARGALLPHADGARIAHAFFAFYLTIAIRGVQTGISVDDQEALLRGVLSQHLIGLVPP